MGLSSRLIEDLRGIVGDEGVLSDPHALAVYENDGFPIAKGRALAAVLPTTTSQVAQCVKLLAQYGVSIVPRGSGTGLTGGCVAFDRGVIIVTTRMTRIESIDLANRLAVVQAGVRNRDLSDAVAGAWAKRPAATSVPTNPHQDDRGRWSPPPGLRFAPDPSSEAVSTLGGNVATNAGGLSTLKYGVTCQHILGIEMVLADGQVVTTFPRAPKPTQEWVRHGPGGAPGGRSGGGSGGGSLYEMPGPDVTSLLCGSEGTLGIITRVWCRLTPIPSRFRTVRAVFARSDDACEAVSDVIAAGVIPSSMEMLDGVMLSVIEQAFGTEFPAKAQAMLLIEIDGPSDPALDEQLETIRSICRARHATDTRHSGDPQERAELWSMRKRAFGAIGRISRSYCTQDACIPRSKLAQAMKRIAAISREHGLTVTNVFHAGDGNVHPILLFDEDDPQQVQRVLHASERILEYCISIDGTITGEHGVGVEKLALMPKMFNPDTLDAFTAIKEAFDPRRRINDAKLTPSPKLRIELTRPGNPNTPGGAL